MSTLCPPPSPRPPPRRPASRCCWLPTPPRARLPRTWPSPWLARWSGANSDGRRSPFPRGQAQVAKQIAALSGGQRLVVVALADGTPAQAAALAARLPAGHDLLWVAPPVPRRSRLRPTGRSSPPARIPGRITARRPHGSERPDKPGAGSQPGSWSPTGALATATLTAAYASTAYRLESVSTQARAVISWAEEQWASPTSGGQPGRAASTAPGSPWPPSPRPGSACPTTQHPVAADQGLPRRRKPARTRRPGVLRRLSRHAHRSGPRRDLHRQRPDHRRTLPRGERPVRPGRYQRIRGSDKPVRRHSRRHHHHADSPKRLPGRPRRPEPVPELRPGPRQRHLGTQPVPLLEPLWDRESGSTPPRTTRPPARSASPRRCPP